MRGSRTGTDPRAKKIMKVAEYNGMRIAVLSRDEHCPPHVHVDGGDWAARYTFAFWHNGVRLWDAVPNTGRVMRHDAGIVAAIKEALPAVRARWVDVMNDICLGNQVWVEKRRNIIPPAKALFDAGVTIYHGTYDRDQRHTVLQLADGNQVTIAL